MRHGTWPNLIFYYFLNNVTFRNVPPYISTKTNQNSIIEVNLRKEASKAIMRLDLSGVRIEG